MHLVEHVAMESHIDPYFHWKLTFSYMGIKNYVNKIQKIAGDWRLRDIIFGWHHLNWDAFIIDNTSEKAVEKGWEKTRKPWSSVSVMGRCV